MADNYLNFSEVIPQLSEQEAQWLQDQLQVVYVFGDREYAESEVPEDLDPHKADWIGCRAYRDLPGCEPDDAENVGFEYEFSGDDKDEDWGRYVWLYAEEWADLERVAHLVQKFLEQFRPEGCWSLSWATTCSKPRVGEFGGGALFVTAEDVTWQNAYDFIEDQKRAVKLRQDVAKLIQRAEQLGIQAEDLDEPVHDAASDRASTINNAGVDEQIEWLVGQLGLDTVGSRIMAMLGPDGRIRHDT